MRALLSSSASESASGCRPDRLYREALAAVSDTVLAGILARVASGELLEKDGWVVDATNYIVHEWPVGRAASNYLAMVDLASYGFADAMEQVWLTSLAGGQYQVSCIPFRIYGLALNDVVALDLEGKMIVRVLARSGHRVYRALLAPTLSYLELDRMRNSIICAVTDDDLKSEWSGDRHVAIDVPPGRGVGNVSSVIDRAAAIDKASWEWGDVEELHP